jgi:eukaryotic-like serine/threonine-protein kinase
MTMATEPAAPITIGRYVLHDRIASGGMAAVFLARLDGPVGFARTVAIKRLHPQFAADSDFVTMFLDEARLAARIQHPNVVPTLDIVATGGELFLVMEYVRGESASQLVRRAAQRNEHIPQRIVAAIVSGVLQGLHAAHEAHDESGAALEIVHRDVSPQNILVGLDGTPRVLDFGVAKAEGKFHSTRGGEIKGKILYMSPEQLEADHVDRTTDVYAMGLVLFELLTNKRMFQKSQDMTSLGRILRNELTLPSSIDPSLARWDPIIRKASAGAREQRYPNARAMAIEVERVCGIASPVEVADWVENIAGDTIRERTRRVAELESGRAQIPRGDIQAALASELARGSAASVPSEVSEIASAATAGSQVAQAIDSDAVDFRPKSRWRKIWPVALGAAVVLGGAAFFVQRQAGAPQPTVAAPPPPVTTALVTATATTATPQVQTAVIAPNVKPPATTEEEAPSATASAPSTKPAVTAKPVVAKPAPAKPNCDKPYTIDAQGHKHFRTECL